VEEAADGEAGEGLFGRGVCHFPHAEEAVGSERFFVGGGGIVVAVAFVLAL